MKAHLIKTSHGLIPNSSESETWYNKIKIGAVVSVEASVMRNYKFHKKLFALLNLSFSYWNPGEISSEYGVPAKSFDRFRKDLTILAGYYHTEIRIDGSVRVVADSVSFARMDNETFDKLYNSILTIVIDKISVLNTMTKEEVNDLVDKFLEFA